MSSSDGHGRAEYICVDEYPEALRGSAGHTNDAADIFNVEAFCAGIMCPPYNTYKEVTCVVCTN